MNITDVLRVGWRDRKTGRIIGAAIPLPTDLPVREMRRRFNPSGDKDDIDHECSLMGQRGLICQRPEPITEDDFRDQLDSEPMVACKCGEQPKVDFCPLCQHPELRPGEHCFCNAREELYEEARFKTKRKAVAYDFEGKVIPGYVAIIIQREETNRILAELMIDRAFLFN